MKNLLLKLAVSLERFFIQNGWVLMKTMRLLSRERSIDLSYKGWDYIRYSSLELCAHEINSKGIKGAIAELGVFKGEFAQKINESFPNRKFYLYDTFSGFDERDVVEEQSRNFSDGKEDFSATSVEMVLNRMPKASNCVVRKGYFPDTIQEEKNEDFVFVSLDADLYKPIYEGLCFFYPRLANGGYIFVHDFNNNLYSGAREAVTQFCNERQIGFFPLSDIGGTAIITK